MSDEKQSEEQGEIQRAFTQAFEAETLSGSLRAKRSGQAVAIVCERTGAAATLECQNVPIAKRVMETAQKLIACGASSVEVIARDLMQWHGEGQQNEVRDYRFNRCPICDCSIETPAGADIVCYNCGSSFSVEANGCKRAVV